MEKQSRADQSSESAVSEDFAQEDNLAVEDDDKEELSSEAELATDEPLSPELEAACGQYLGQWIRLVSTTNWEKGQIICAWREALEAAGAPAASCTDEAWSRRVGNVTPQHAGRLRRVYQKFHGIHEQYEGLYWSHFQAALDWDDAEMWLEGAVQNSWSISQMRQQRWEALGAPAEKKPRDEDIIQAELDEDVDSTDDPQPNEPVGPTVAEVRDADDEDSDEGTPFDADDEADDASWDDAPDPLASEASVTPIRPFENVGELPSDLAEAFEMFKLAILAHKLTDWEEIDQNKVLGVLESLKQLALAPSADQ